MVVVQRIQKVCKAPGCNVKFAGYPASKFCSPACRKKGEAKAPFVFETILIKSEEIVAKEEAYKKEETAKETKRAILSLPTDKKPMIYSKPNSGDLIREVKVLLAKSVTLDQVISNIASRHKYKKPESYVSHIEDLLVAYDGTQD